MVDTTSTSIASKTLKAKKVRRRLSRIAAETDPKVAHKKKRKLAMKIIRQIASGDIKNPRVVARAFVNANADAGE